MNEVTLVVGRDSGPDGEAVPGYYAMIANGDSVFAGATVEEAISDLFGSLYPAVTRHTGRLKKNWPPSSIEDGSIMNFYHPRWDEFVERLDGPEGCNFRKDDDGEIHWDCTAKKDRGHAIKIMKDMGVKDIEGSLLFFNENGGFCDCEILFNVNVPAKREAAERPTLVEEASSKSDGAGSEGKLN